MRVWIFDRHGEGIPQSLLSMGKADAVLGKVAGGLGRIKLEFDALIMHNLCIFRLSLIPTAKPRPTPQDRAGFGHRQVPRNKVPMTGGVLKRFQSPRTG